MSIGNVELTISNGGWNGDFVRAPNGDLMLSVDTLDEQPATIERLTRVILTVARKLDTFQNPISRGDHPFYQDFGAGIQAYIGENYSEELTTQIESDITASLSDLDDILPDPTPTIDFEFNDPILSITLSVTTSTGQLVTTPSVDIVLGGG